MSKDEAVYRWFEKRADADGFVEAGCPVVAKDLMIPLRTVQGIVTRLEKQGRICLIGYRRFAVVNLCE